MAPAAKDDERNWQPATETSFSPRTVFGRFLSFWAYPFVAPFAVFSVCNATVENAQWWKRTFLAMAAVLSAVVHPWVASRFFPDESITSPSLAHIGAQIVAFLAVVHPPLWMAFISWQLTTIFAVDRKENRINAGRLKGNKVIVIGNGPSAVEGAQLGEQIDKFDEVVRFNNFQTKVAGMQKWVGSKCTVHFSDGVLFPTYQEYFVPGATVILSLFVDRFMVAGSYFILRGAADLQTSLTSRFLHDPTTTWISKERIEELKKNLKLAGVKHPTSGMLAIDHFVRQPGVELPVYIHGFDFFQGPKMHYFDEHEPWYERLNDRIGVNMHSPHKEKVYVEELIKQGKVKFLKDKK